MKKILFVKNARLKTIMVLVIIGSLYGFISAIRNQNPYYPAVGSKVQSQEQMFKAWDWEPSPIWFPSYLLCRVPRNGLGICHTKSGYLFRSEGGRVLYFTGSAFIGLLFGVVLGILRITRLMAGLLLGIPFGFIFRIAAVWVLNDLLGMDNGPIFLMTFIACTAGFIIFASQPGRRCRWYMCGLVHGCMAIPVTFLFNPSRMEDIFPPSHWGWLWDDVGHIFVEHLIVFILLFTAGRLFLYISRLWKVPYFVEENVR